MGDIADEDALRFCDEGCDEDPGVEVTGVFQHLTDKAVLVLVDNENTWFPISQMTAVKTALEDLSKGEMLQFEIPLWLAEKKGLA